MAAEARERVHVRIADNAVVYASRFCLENCGFAGQASDMVAVVTAVEADTLVSVDQRPGETLPRTRLACNQPAPEIAMVCDGPRPQFWIAGKLVCRGTARCGAIGNE